MPDTDDIRSLNIPINRKSRGPSRSEMQASIDASYTRGLVSLEAWRQETARLSQCDHNGEPLLPPLSVNA